MALRLAETETDRFGFEIASLLKLDIHSGITLQMVPLKVIHNIRAVAPLSRQVQLTRKQSFT